MQQGWIVRERWTAGDLWILLINTWRRSLRCDARAVLWMATALPLSPQPHCSAVTFSLSTFGLAPWNCSVSLIHTRTEEQRHFDCFFFFFNFIFRFTLHILSSWYIAQSCHRNVDERSPDMRSCNELHEKRHSSLIFNYLSIRITELSICDIYALIFFFLNMFKHVTTLS